MKNKTPVALEDLPLNINGPAAWLGSAMRNDPQLWQYNLSATDIADLENAARCFLDSGLDLGKISPSAFPLNSFCSHIEKLTQQLMSGVGVEVMSGLPVSEYSEIFAMTVFCGIGAHIGSARSQNAQGHIVGNVRDIGADASDPKSRIYQTSARQTFHTDSADVVGLMCKNVAKSGGESLLVSAESIYNRMRVERPDLLLRLFDPIATDRRGEVPEGASPFMQIPVFSWYDNKLTVFYQRQYIDSAQRFESAPRLTPQHIDALNMFDALANESELYFDMHLQPGDMQFVYNHSQLHDRTAFLDWPEPHRRRHMLRLWLSLPDDRKLPESFKQRYGSIEPGNRGGIITPHGSLQAPPA